MYLHCLLFLVQKAYKEALERVEYRIPLDRVLIGEARDVSSLHEGVPMSCNIRNQYE